MPRNINQFRPSHSCASSRPSLASLGLLASSLSSLALRILALLLTKLVCYSTLTVLASHFRSPYLSSPTCSIAMGCPVRRPIVMNPTDRAQQTRNLAQTRKVCKSKLELNQPTHETLQVRSGIRGGFGVPNMAHNLDGSHRFHQAGSELGLEGVNSTVFMFFELIILHKNIKWNFVM